MASKQTAAFPGTGRGRERAVLGVTLAAAAALAATAFSPAIDPERAGEDALRRQAGATAQAVRTAWRRMQREGELGAPVSELFTWGKNWRRPGGGAPPLPAEAADPDGAPGVALLIALSEEAELGSGEDDADLDRARDFIQRALALEGLSAGQHALLILRAVQLAALAGDGDAVRDAWELARASLTGAETVGGTSILLLAAFAAGRYLSPQEGRVLRAELSTEWIENRLALPEEEPRLVVDGEAPFRVRVERAWGLIALRERLRGLSPEAGVYEGLDERFRARRTLALEEALGTLPTAPAATEGALLTTQLGILHVQGDGRGGVRANFVDLAAAGAELVLRSKQAGWLPEGFELELVGEGAVPFAGEGERVTEAAPLVEDRLDFALRHGDPRALKRSESRRALATRAGLLALAVFLAAAGMTTFRALRRERRLQRLRSRFVADVSHELRTPLASILLMAENLEAGHVTEEAARHRYHTLIRREARRLARLVEDVLDFSRLERGERPRLRIEEVELAAYSKQLEAELRSRLQSAGVELEFASMALPARAMLDPESFRRAIENLVDNGVKHGAGPIEVRLGVEGAVLVCAVRDHGAGLSASDAERVFRPFERLAGNEVGGTGLGLAIVREIARAHGGEATARAPEEGAGMVFELRIPSGCSEAEESEA